MLNITRWPYPRVIAHRCGGVHAPENTLVGIRVAGSLRFAGVEFDVRLARYGVPVLMHDRTLERTTSGAGPVSALDAAELRALDAGSWFGNEYAGEHVPTFQAAATLCRGLGLWTNVEIKADTAEDAAEAGRVIAGQAAHLWRTASPAPLLSSFSEAALAAAREAAPDLPRALLVHAAPADWRERLTALGCRALHCHHETVTPELVAALHEAGFAVLAYTVNAVGRAVQLFQMGVDAVVTDELRDVRPDLPALFGIAS
jgi:glycerophosphoryl diester phosphodiesterase